jgi:hypothetical protein
MDLLAKCKFYKGEDDCPYGVPFICWECEEMYVEHMSKGDESFFKDAVDFYCHLGLDMVPELNDDNPIEVKAIMFERFCHNSDTDPEILARYFTKYYLREWLQKDRT